MSTGKSASEMTPAEYATAKDSMVREGRLSRYRDPPAPAAPELAPEARIDAELKRLATAAGMVDLDDLKLADLSTVKINKDGEVEGAAVLMAGLRKTKPYLFPKSATEMTKEEYAASKAALIAKR